MRRADRGCVADQKAGEKSVCAPSRVELGDLVMAIAVQRTMRLTLLAATLCCTAARPRSHARSAPRPPRRPDGGRRRRRPHRRCPAARAYAAVVAVSEEEKALQMKVMTHQKSARLGMAEDARSLVAYSAVRGAVDALVGGGLSVGVAGQLWHRRGAAGVCFSSMSRHTKDLNAGEAALTVTAKGFEGAADGRVTLIGDVKQCDDGEVEARSCARSPRRSTRARSGPTSATSPSIGCTP